MFRQLINDPGFGGPLTPLGGFTEATDGVEGVSLARRRAVILANEKAVRRYQPMLAATAQFLDEVYNGMRPPYHMTMVRTGEKQLDCSKFGLKETMTPSDFTTLFGDIIDRSMLANYKMRPGAWRQTAQIRPVRDFRTANIFRIDGAQTPLSEVLPAAQYRADKVTDAKYTISLAKYGRVIPMAWENIINDDLGAFNDLPDRLSQAAVHTEMNAWTRLFMDATSFLASFFNNTSKNIVNTTNGAVTNNPALSQAGLEDAVTVLRKQIDGEGMPIAIEGMILSVPPDLEVRANKIVNDVQAIQYGPGGSTSEVANVLLTSVPGWQRRIRVVVNDWQPIVTTSAPGKTMWFLFADPASTARPALRAGFLPGRENPEIFLKSSNSIRLGGGGLTDPLEGSFENDSIEYKVRHVFGFGLMDPKGVVVSRGDGNA